MTILTDTERLRAGPTDIGALRSSQSVDAVALGKKQGAELAAKSGGGAFVLDLSTGNTSQQGAALFKQQVEEARKIAGSVRAAVPTGLGAATMSVDGRLAMASVIVQTIGIINGRQAVAQAEAELAKAGDTAERAQKEKALRNAQLGYMDSMGGLVAGSMDTLRVAVEAMNIQRGAATGSVALNSIHALKFGAQLAGVFGGFLNGYVSYLKAGEAREKGLELSAYAHIVAAAAYVGTGAASFAGAGLATAQFIVERQIGSAAVQHAAKRFVATRVAGMALGAAVPVVGWALLGIGIVASVGAALMEPTRLEAWARQTPFGKGPEEQKFKTLEEQEKALYEAMGLTATPESQEDRAA